MRRNEMVSSGDEKNDQLFYKVDFYRNCGSPCYDLFPHCKLLQFIKMWSRGT